MNGNTNPYDPTQMFKDWLEKGGKAQAEFMKTFGTLMQNKPTQNFDPMEFMKEMTDKASQTQSNIMENLGSMQKTGMESLFNLGQFMPKISAWGAFKTTVGSNGRISIPEAERAAIGIKEGDLIQVVVLPIDKKATKGVTK